jgi:hypothetical protein
MRPLVATVSAAMILSAALVIGEPFQFDSCASRLTAQNTAPAVPAPSPNHPSARTPKDQRHRCKLKFHVNGRKIVTTVPISEPNTPVILSGPDLSKSCEAIHSSCANLVVAVPTPEGGICCQNGKNRPHLCSGLDLRFLRGPEWKLRLITTPLSTSGLPR